MSRSSQLTLDLIAQPKPSLHNFVVGRNAELLSALRAVAAGAGERFVYLWGELGAGRSHLLQALAGVVEPGSVPAFDRRRSLYVVDDVHRCDEAAQQQLFVLLNEIRAHESARFVGAGSSRPMTLDLREDIRTRLAWGLVYQLHALTDREKAHALAAHAALRGIELPADVVDYILTHMPRDMRTLVGIVNAVDSYALSVKKAITLPLVRQWEQHADGGSPP